MTKNREKKNRKMIFGSELSEANNEPTFGKHQKNNKNREKLCLAQNFLKRKMSQLSEYTKKN